MKYYSYFFLRLVFILAASLSLTVPCNADEKITIYDDLFSFDFYYSGEGKEMVAKYAVLISANELELQGHVSIPSSFSYTFEYFDEDDGEFHDLVLTAPVTRIGSHAFWYCSKIISVSIPNTVTEIGDDAFFMCRNMANVSIPSSVNHIGSRAFEFCEALISVNIPNSVNYIGKEAFSGCTSLLSVTIPNSITKICELTFASCSSLSSVTIPNSVDTIGEKAFIACSGLSSVTISNSVTEIGLRAFEGCSNMTNLAIGNSVKKIGDYAFCTCSSLSSVTIPNSVREIGGDAFLDCSDLTTVTIGNSVTTIGFSAFNGCTSLTSVIIPNSVTTIKAGAFIGCQAMKSLTISSNVSSIGRTAFAGCSGLCDIYSAIKVPGDVDLGNDVFNLVPYNSCVLHVPPGTEELYRNAAQWKRFLISGSMSTSFHKGFNKSFGDKAPRGVTADGTSRMYIFFDHEIINITSCNVKMTIDGEEISDKSITGDLGEIKVLPNGRYGFDYCAPEVFADRFSTRNSYDVNIEAEAFVNGGSSIKGTATVTVMRPGVLLLHGLFSDRNCFKELTDYLLSTGGYESYQVLNGNYKSSNSESFHSNTYVRKVVNGHLDQLFRQLADEGIISSKYDLVGHSMGGILSRKYAQEVNAEAVNRIITLDTPHSGSQLATIYRPLMNWIQNTAVATIFSNPVLSIALSALHLYFDNSRFAAIEDLLPSGYGIAKLNNPDMLARAAGIPVHAVASYMYQGTHAEPESCVENAELLDGMSVLYYLECEETQVQDNDFGFRLWKKLYKDENDGIVPLESQTGGLTEPNITLKSDTYRGIMGRKSNAFHCRTNHWNSTIENITDLLLCPKDNNFFSTEGFHPVDLSSTSMEKTVPDKPFKQASPSSFIQLNISPEDATRTLEVNVTPSSDLAHYIVFAFTDDDHILINGDVQETQFIIPDTYEGTLKVYALGRTVNDELVADIDSIDYTSVTSLLSLRYEVEQTITMSVGQSLSLSVIADWDNGQQQYVDPTFTTSDASIISINDQTLTAKGEGQCVLTATFKGMTCYKTINVIPGDFIVGDVNGDMEVNILDVDAIIGYILSHESVVIPDVADVNSDGEVNIIDIDAVIAIILNN